MAGIFSGVTKLSIAGTYKDASRDLTVPTTSIAYEISKTWATGSSYRIYEDTLSLAGAAQNIDLYGSLADMYGDTLSFAKIHGLIIYNKATTTGYDIELSGNFWTGSLLTDWVDDAAKELIEPGGWFVRTSPVDGYAVTNTTKERITLDPGANTIACDVWIWGTE